ncbi:MAG: uroporphyrinogen decarboxylase family protein, partial [Paracoccaceae bacterium]
DALKKLRPVADIHDMLSPIYQTVKILAAGLPPETALIGFAGAPWTVATYMIAGRGTPDQAPAHRLISEDRATFEGLIERITDATILYLSKQIEAGAEVVKLFDSWAGSLRGEDFERYAIAPVARIISEIKALHPQVPVIAFPREAGARYQGFARAVGADCLALDNSVSPGWAAEVLQVDGCVQGNLAPHHMVSGGQALVDETRRIKRAFCKGPHIFNLGHGITPDAQTENVALMVATIRENLV